MRKSMCPIGCLVIHGWSTSTNRWSTTTLLWHRHVCCFADAKISRQIDFMGVHFLYSPATRNSGGSWLACSPMNSHTHQQRLQNPRGCCCSLSLPGGHQVDGLPPAPSGSMRSPCSASYPSGNLVDGLPLVANTAEGRSGPALPP